MWKSIASNAITFLIVGLFLCAGLILWGTGQYSAKGPLDRAMCLKVDRGSNFKQVSADLEKSGAISNGRIFRMGVDYADKNGDLKAGSFLIEPNTSMEEIVDIVTRGGASTCGTEIVYRIGVTRSQIQVRELDPQTNRFIETAKFDPSKEDAPAEYIETRDGGDARYRIALAEGVTSWQIVDSLKQIDVLSGDAPNVPEEGSLAPDSYEVKKDDTIASVLERMQSAQSERLASAWANRVDGLPLKTPEEALTLASIIEKETGVASERGVVSSVFINRLNRGIKLQTDPTVIYGITKGEGVLGRGLRRSELRKETPYNTYVISALPPTPIANPGLASIQAALDPETTNYIFFVADGTGGHVFAETLAEHNANVAKWRKIEAERNSGE